MRMGLCMCVIVILIMLLFYRFCSRVSLLKYGGLKCDIVYIAYNMEPIMVV